MGNKFKDNIVTYKMFLPDTNAAYIQYCKCNFFFICNHLSLITQGYLYNITLFICMKGIINGNLKFYSILKELVEFKGKEKSKTFHKLSFNVYLERGKKVFVPQQQFRSGPPQESEMKAVQIVWKDPSFLQWLWIRTNCCSHWFQQYTI